MDVPTQSAGTFVPFRTIRPEHVIDAVCLARPAAAHACLVFLEKLMSTAERAVRAGNAPRPINMQSKAFVKRCGAPLRCMPHVLSLLQHAGFVCNDSDQTLVRVVLC